jgi:uncharacterized protein YndB with AHSA1/START domain
VNADLTLRVDDSERPVLLAERELRASPQDVWDALTQPVRFREYLYCELSVEDGWRPGSRLTMTFPPEVIDLTGDGEVLEVDEPRLLAYRWEDSRLRYELATHGSGTGLRLAVEVPRMGAALAAATWGIYLDRLAGETPPATDWGVRYHRYAAQFIPLLGAQEGPPVHLQIGY